MVISYIGSPNPFLKSLHVVSEESSDTTKSSRCSKSLLKCKKLFQPKPSLRIATVFTASLNHIHTCKIVSATLGHCAKHVCMHVSIYLINYNHVYTILCISVNIYAYLLLSGTFFRDWPTAGAVESPVWGYRCTCGCSCFMIPCNHPWMGKTTRHKTQLIIRNIWHGHGYV